MGRDKTLVLGSGISALAYLFYNPNSFALAGDQIGGLFKQAASLGPQLLWVTPSTTKFLLDLGVNGKGSGGYPWRTVKVGYYGLGRLHSEEDLKDSMGQVRSDYSFKTRGTAPKSSHMSSGKGSFEVFDLPVQELVDILLKKVRMRLIPGKAIDVDLYDQTVQTKDRQFEYDTLVSTIPAPVLLSLVGPDGIGNELEAYDKVYQKVTPDEGLWKFEDDANIMGYEYVYVVSDEHDFHRTRIVRNASKAIEYVVREFTLTPAMTGKYGMEYPKGLLQRGGQIISGGEVLRELPPSVVLAGRYAEWKHEVRFEQVVEAIQSDL